MSSVKTSVRVLCHRAPNSTSNKACSSPAGPLGILHEHMRKLWSHTQDSCWQRVALVCVSSSGTDGNPSRPHCSALQLASYRHHLGISRHKVQQCKRFQHLPVSWRVISTSQGADSEGQFLVLLLPLLPLSPRVWQPRQIPPEMV